MGSGLKVECMTHSSRRITIDYVGIHPHLRSDNLEWYEMLMVSFVAAAIHIARCLHRIISRKNSDPGQQVLHVLCTLQHMRAFRLRTSRDLLLFTSGKNHQR